MKQTDLDDLVRRLRLHRSDDSAVEVKSSVRSLGSAVWESVSAFANTSGGILLLGLTESEGFTPAEGFDPRRIIDQFIDGIGDANPAGARLTHPPRYAVQRFSVDSAPVLAITIEENSPGSKPCYITARGPRSGGFKRVDDKDVRLSATEVYELENSMTSSDADRAVVPEADMADLAGDRVSDLLAAKRSRKALARVRNETEALTRLNVLDKQRHVRLAGLLVVGSYPQQFYPRLLVDVTVHPTLEKSAPGEQLRFLDRVQCEGPLADVVADAVTAVTRNLRTHSVVVSTGRRDEPEVPTTVIREAIANAVLHREYHEYFRGQPVTVDVYPDRIVIASPGGLWGGKTLDNLADGTSKCRNQTLLQLLQDVPLSSGDGATVEGQGGGIRLMINEMVAHSLATPTFMATADQVTVELRRHGAEVPEHRAWLSSITHRDLTAHEDAALLFAHSHGHVSVDTLRDRLRVDSDDARSILRRLSGEGLLRPDGPEDYVLSDGAPRFGTVALDVLNVLSSEQPLDIHRIAEATGKTPNALRPILRSLIADGRVRATAPPSSRHRRYLRAE